MPKICLFSFNLSKIKNWRRPKTCLNSNLVPLTTQPNLGWNRDAFSQNRPNPKKKDKTINMALFNVNMSKYAFWYTLKFKNVLLWFLILANSGGEGVEVRPNWKWILNVFIYIFWCLLFAFPLSENESHLPKVKNCETHYCHKSKKFSNKTKVVSVQLGWYVR